MVSWDAAEVSYAGRLLRRSRLRLADPGAGRRVRARSLTVLAPDVPTLTRLVTSGLLSGSAARLQVRVASVPPALRTGLRPSPTSRHTTVSAWRRTGSPLRPGLAALLGWDEPRPVDRALAEALAMLTRDRRWGWAGGPVEACDRAAWLAGDSSWPHGHLLGAGPPDPPEGGERLGPWVRPRPLQLPVREPLVTAVANPYGRVLLGAPARYRLQVAGARLLLCEEQGAQVLALGPDAAPERSGGWQKFCTVTVPADLPGTPFAMVAVQGLAAAGAVLVAPDPAVRDRLAGAGLGVLAAHPDVEADGDLPFPAYARSVASSRAALVAGDAVLRRTALAGRSALPLPTVSAVVSSKRADDVETCLAQLCAQDYPAYEVVLGTHGHDLDPDVVAWWRERFPAPLRVVALPAALTLGEALARLSRVADGDFVTKVDDDDRYGPEHLTDLVLAARTSGADLVAKSSRFTHFADAGVTVDRAWGAPEVFDVTPAGGTLLLPRGALHELGGWSTSPRHVDTDLIARARAAGLLRYRTASLGYVYVRRSSGHTWAADHDALLGQGEHRYDGLPPAILEPTASLLGSLAGSAPPGLRTPPTTPPTTWSAPARR